MNLEAQLSWREGSGARAAPAVRQRVFSSKHITYLCLTDIYR